MSGLRWDGLSGGGIDIPSPDDLARTDLSPRMADERRQVWHGLERLQLGAPPLHHRIEGSKLLIGIARMAHHQMPCSRRPEDSLDLARVGHPIVEVRDPRK